MSSVILECWDSRVPPESTPAAFRVDRIAVQADGSLGFEGVYPDGEPFTVRVRGTDKDGRTVTQLIDHLRDNVEQHTGRRP